MTAIFLKILHIMGYNLKNVRNGKSISKIPKWRSLMSLHVALKSKLIHQFEVLENLEHIYGKCCWRARPCSPTTFSLQIFLVFLKIQTIKISFFNTRGFKLGHFDVLDMLFSISHILEVAAYNFMKSRSRDGLAAKGL